MRDKGTVVSTENGFAQVEVSCLEACQGCSASSLCIGSKNDSGLLSVKNTLRAETGDLVLLSIPEDHYSKALLLLFGVLLSAILVGLGLGYLVSQVLALSSSGPIVLGTVLSVALAGTWLFHRFKKINNKSLYPEITAILNKGGSYG